MIQRKGDNPPVYFDFHEHEVLPRSTSTMLIDSDEIPVLQSFRASISCVAVDGTGEPITEDVASVGTLSELLDKVCGDKTKKKVVLFRNKADITSIRTKCSWYIFTFSGSKCCKSLTREDVYFNCKACKSKVEYPRTRFRIQADITDGTMSTVVVLFDEIVEQLVKRTAKSLVKELQDTSVDAPILPSALQSLIGTKHTFEIKSHTYYHFGEYESLNCVNIVGPASECADKDVCPKTPAARATSTDPLKRSAPGPYPSPKTGRKLRKFCVEDSTDDTDGMTPGHMDLTGVINDIDDGEKGSH
ncbi:putative nucleic acid-binding, replication factor A [Helianthus debilis subsp. tardiflorus]